MIQQPDPIVETTGTTAGKDSEGRPTLEVSKVVEVHGKQIHRTYYAVRRNDRFAFVIYTASTKEIFNKYLSDYKTLTQSLAITPEASPEKQ